VRNLPLCHLLASDRKEGMMTPTNSDELQRLLSALCDGIIADDEQALLQQLLEDDAECRQVYLDYLDTHARLLLHPDVCSASPAPGPASSGSQESADQGSIGAVAAAPSGDPSPARRRGFPHAVSYFVVAGATLAASIVLQVLWLHPESAGQQNAALASARTPALGEYVATLAQTSDCVWEQDHRPGVAGSRLKAGALALQKGVARIRFDSGPDLVVEGPASVRLESSSEATVLQGKVVVRADETAAPFDLHTPSSTLIDLGAEYAVAVSPTGEEVHVFDGEVQRTPMPGSNGGTPEHLTAGEARCYGPLPETPGRPAHFDPSRFVRHLSPAAGKSGEDDRDLAAELLAYEGFDYRDPDILGAGAANGGYGWTSPWTPGFARPLLENDLNVIALNVKEGLARPGSAVSSLGGSFDYAGFSKYHRRLATPVRLDEDRVYFLSFLFRRAGPLTDPSNALAILFRSTDELPPDKWDARKRLNIGVGGTSHLFTHLAGISKKTSVPLRPGETYLMVAKIVANSAAPDQVFMRVYGPEEQVEPAESGIWTVVGQPFESSAVFDWLEIHINSRTRQTIDEIRLGTTWSAVTAPWLPEKKE
jgi:hypothetical protein